MALLECKGLSKWFGNVPALNQLDLAIEPGHVVGLLGPNGSGKTTLLKLANGLLTPSSGEILINGEKPGKKTKASVSYLPDRPCLPEWMKTEQLVDFYEDFFADFERARAVDMLARLGIDPEQRIRAMSKGTREKVQLILTMSRRAQLYLLDEPIGGVDPATRDYILDTILRNYDPGATIVISTHLIADVEQVLDDIIFISGGRIVLRSDVDEIREKNNKSVDALFREVFRC